MPTFKEAQENLKRLQERQTIKKEEELKEK